MSYSAAAGIKECQANSSDITAGTVKTSDDSSLEEKIEKIVTRLLQKTLRQT